MKWFKKLSDANKIAFLSLLLGLLSLIFLIYQAQDEKENNLSPSQSSSTEIQTSGNNSPIVHDANGNVKIEFNTAPHAEK